MIGLNIAIVVGADNQLLDPTDPNNYINSYLKMTGNYTIDDLTMVELYGKAYFPSIMQRDNFLCINEEGDFVFSFNFDQKSVTDDLSENTISEYYQAKNLEHIDVESKYILAEDINYLVENLTDIDIGETYLYNPTTAFTTVSYPYLYVPNLYSATTAANTTIIIKQGATSTTILNEQITSGAEFWYDLTEDFTPTTVDNITISSSIIDSGVFIFSLDSSKTLEDTRYLTTYIDEDAAAPWTVSEITNVPSTFDRDTGVNCHAVVTSWGNKDLLEGNLLKKIVAIDDLITDVGDIQDYALAAAKVVNALPDVAFQVAKSFCQTAQEKTSQVRDFSIKMEADTIAASKVTIDDPSDTFDDEYGMSWWTWFKENTKNCWDITKAGIAGILHGDAQGEWGVDVYDAIVDAQGEIEEAPTCLQSISNAMYKSIGWYMNYAKITIPLTIGLGVITTIGIALWIGKRFL